MVASWEVGVVFFFFLFPILRRLSLDRRAEVVMDGWTDEKKQGSKSQREKKNVVLDWFILELSHIVNYVVKACQRLQSPQKKTLWFVFKLFEDRNCSVQKRS